MKMVAAVLRDEVLGPWALMLRDGFPLSPWCWRVICLSARYVWATYFAPIAMRYSPTAFAKNNTAATLAILSLLLAGCNGTLPAVPTEVRIPVPVACIAQADIPTATFATDAELAALPDGPFVLALARDRLERQGHIGALEAILQACAEKSPGASGAKTTSGGQ